MPVTTYEQGLANLSKNSDVNSKRKARLRLATKIFNTCREYGMAGMDPAGFLMRVGFTKGEVKIVLKQFLSAKVSGDTALNV